MAIVLAYAGPQCPRCGTTLPAESIRSGTVLCNSCEGVFVATAFAPPERRVSATETAVSFPEGANACANHARNAAVTSCQRCGLFICSLCEMNIGQGTFCPSCFDRVRAEGTLKETATRYKDYASMARLTVIAGFLIWCVAPLTGIFAFYYARKGMQQRRNEGRSVVGMVVVQVFAVLQIFGGIALIIAIFWDAFK